MKPEDRPYADLWEAVSSRYHKHDDDGQVVIRAETGRPKIRAYPMAQDLSLFAIKNNLDGGTLITHSHVLSWERRGLITRRFQPLFSAFLEHLKAQEAITTGPA